MLTPSRTIHERSLARIDFRPAARARLHQQDERSNERKREGEHSRAFDARTSPWRDPPINSRKGKREIREILHGKLLMNKYEAEVHENKSSLGSPNLLYLQELIKI